MMKLVDQHGVPTVAAAKKMFNTLDESETNRRWHEAERARRGAREAAGDGGPPAPESTERYNVPPSQDIETLIRAANFHGEISDPQHETGDLQTLARTLWRYMTPEQRAMAFQADESRELLRWLDDEAL